MAATVCRKANNPILASRRITSLKLLIVEDEGHIREPMKQFLCGEGHVCEECSTYASASRKIEVHEYDIILIDIMLPGGSGIELIKEVKTVRPETGIIIISARTSLEDKIRGLDAGADDYLTKPFHLTELNSRIKALLRRRMQQGSESLAAGPLRLWPAERKIYIGERMVDLTRKEFDLVLFLAVNPNRVITRETIAEHLLGDNADLMDNFDFIYTHINNVRRKLSAHGVTSLLKTMYGVGYKLDTHETPE